jgi:hypothetical protein
MLIDRFAPAPDAYESHRIEIDAPAAAVYAALWTADLAASPVIRGLMALRSLPKVLTGAAPSRPAPASFRLQALIDAGFGRLAEDEGREVVLGVSGRFWRPVDNLLPFREADFHGPVPAGTARAVWNFAVTETAPGRTTLTTDTRVVCGDAASRAKFRAYWLFVRPFSGLIRIVMLRAVAQECRRRRTAG